MHPHAKTRILSSSSNLTATTLNYKTDVVAVQRRCVEFLMAAVRCDGQAAVEMAPVASGVAPRAEGVALAIETCDAVGGKKVSVVASRKKGKHTGKM